MQRIDEFEEEHKILLRLSNDCQSEYKLLKSKTTTIKLYINYRG